MPPGTMPPGAAPPGMMPGTQVPGMPPMPGVPGVPGMPPGMVPGQSMPGYYDVYDGTTLFKLHFSIKEDIPYDVTVPIQFWWVDCGDNGIATEDDLGDFLALSDMVFDYNGAQINNPNSEFPTNQGANSSCFDPDKPEDPRRLINLYNGKIDITAINLTPFSIRIGNAHNTPLGENVSVPVVKWEGSQAMAGFDFLIGYNADLLTANDVIPGQLFETPGDYEWEYFNYRFDSYYDADLPNYSGLIRVIGLADLYNGIPHASSQYIESVDLRVFIRYLHRTFLCTYPAARTFCLVHITISFSNCNRKIAYITGYIFDLSICDQFNIMMSTRRY